MFLEFKTTKNTFSKKFILQKKRNYNVNYEIIITE